MLSTIVLLLLDGDTPVPPLLDPKAGLFFFTLIVFLIVLFVLWRFAWGPITAALESRERTIEDSIGRAERALAEARQIAEDNQKARREAELGAQHMLRESRAAVEKLRTDEIEKTKEQVRLMQESARAEIEREKLGALDTLRAEVAGLAIQAAEKLLDENMDADRNRKLVETFLDELPSGDGSKPSAEA